MDIEFKNKLKEFILDNFHNKVQVIPLHEPCFIGKEKKYVDDCIQSTFVSSIGKYVNQFELNIAEFTGAKYAIATVNGTAALHIALLLAGVKSNEEVITQPLTFVATSNAIHYLRAIPHLIDIDSETLSLSPDSLREFLEGYAVKKGTETYNKVSGRRISACVPMHTFGHPSKIDEIVEICDAYNLPVVEDAAESLGSFYKDRHTGTFGKLGILSFNGNKIITSGGGGMILTDDDDTARLAKHLTTTAKIPHQWEFDHDRLGFNYRLPNINAALGVAQLENLEFFISKKRELAMKYQEFFKKDGIRFVNEPNNAVSNYWLNAIVLDSEKERDDILGFLNKNKIFVRPAWRLLNDLSMNHDYSKQALDTAEYYAKRLLNLPSSVIIGS